MYDDIYYFRWNSNLTHVMVKILGAGQIIDASVGMLDVAKPENFRTLMDTVPNMDG
jgi:hypothetical protein